MENIQTDSNEIKHSNRGGARPGAGRKKKSNVPLTNESRIAAIEKRIQDPAINPRDLKSLNRELSLLKGEYVPYTRTAEQKRAVKSKPKSDSLPPGWSTLAEICIERRALGLPVFETGTVWDPLIQERNQEFLEHQLDVYEEEAAAKKGMSVSELRQYLCWYARQPREPLPPDCAEVKQGELQRRANELYKRSGRDAMIELLKITQITLNACGPLTDAELQDVVLARAKLAAEKATWRTAEQMAIERFRKESVSI